MQPGTMLTHYRVEEKIGAGGMGEVYRAHDTVLGRDVALKILPPEFSRDSDRLARFQREAKVLASLNHPNIASIFGFENTPDCTFLIMELVEGEDLSQILKRGPLPVDEAVDIARQIAEGLEEAHEKGIIHRDLKPANVKRTSEGKVKVLDFGLARALAGQAAGEGDVGSALTRTAGMTVAGTVLGTAAYMSPEQARGKEVDRRTDIWAFGLILFEMLTGHQLFAGETASDILAGILKTEPDWNILPKDLPWQVERVLRRCLAKDPRQRLRDIGEARVRLENPAAESGMISGALNAADLPSGRGRQWLPWGLLLASLAAVAWFAVGPGRPTLNRPILHLAIPSPEAGEFHLSGSFPGLPVVSPDGRYVVFSIESNTDHNIQLFVRSLDSGTAVALDGTTDAQYPFWSPDSKWVAFYDRSEGLKKIMVGGGPTQTICPAGNGKGGSWNQNGEVLFTADYNAPIQVVAAVGGSPRPVTSLEGDTGFDSHRHPQFLPDGRHFLYLARRAGGGDCEIRMASLDGSPAKVIMNQAAMVQYASGNLLFLNQQILMAQPFKPDTGELSGTPVPVADDVMIIEGAAKGAFSSSNEGTLVYVRGKTDQNARLVWLDLKGNEIGQVCDQAQYESLVLSPDNKRAAVTIMDPQAGTDDIWIVEIDRNFRTRFTTDPADQGYPVWAPDGRSLFYVSNATGQYAVYHKTIGGTGEAELVLELPQAILLWGCGEDGQTIFYSTEGETTGLDLWSADLTGKTEPRLLRRSPKAEAVANLSPDGNWLSFSSSESGIWQSFLAPWPEMSPLVQVSTTSGTWAYWDRGSRLLYYQEEGGSVLGVDLVSHGQEMDIGLPVPMFDFLPVRLEGPWLDLAADGERFLALKQVEANAPAFCDLVINWPARVGNE